jgi:hypothetical protein
MTGRRNSEKGMSLTSDINDALTRLKTEGDLLHWRDYLYPKRRAFQDGMAFQLSIQHVDSGEEIPNDELVNFFSEEQLEFISNFRNAVNRNEENLEKIFEYAESLEEKDLGLKDFESEQIIVEFSLDNGDHLGAISNYEDPFASPKYLLLTALATNLSLQLPLAERITYYAQDAGESSNEGWVALGLVSNPNLASIHSQVINKFVPYLTNYWGDLSSLLLHAEHIENEKLDDASAFPEINTYDIGRILDVDLNHYEWDMMRDSNEVDNPEFIPIYYAANVSGYGNFAKSGIALLDDDSERLVYFGEIEESYKSSFKIVEYPDFTSKVLQPVLEKSSIDLNRYTPEEIHDLFGGTSQDVWDYLCKVLDVRILESLTMFRDQDLLAAILANETMPKELKVLAALEEN